MWSVPREDHNRVFIGLMAALVALAWLALWVWGGSPGGLLYGHHGAAGFGGGGAFVVAFVAGWTAMVVAMMLPSSLPLISLFRALVRRRPDRNLLVALLVAGYLAVWTSFGLAVYCGGWLGQRLVRETGWPETQGWVPAAGILLLAGIYQFTPLKYRCLERCRSPLGFIMEHWRGRHERGRALLLGAYHGLFCVGCCWSLMLLMFVVGAGSLGWMLVLGTVMAVEKNASCGRGISAPLGALLIGLGLSLGIVHALPSPADTAKAALAPTPLSSASGTATFADVPGGVEVKLEVRGLPERGAVYPAHIHPGSCGGHDHARHGTEGYPLTPLVAGPRGRGSSTTVVRRETVAGLFSGDPGFYVNVHAGNPPQAIACGDLQTAGR